MCTWQRNSGPYNHKPSKAVTRSTLAGTKKEWPLLEIISSMISIITTYVIFKVLSYYSHEIMCLYRLNIFEVLLWKTFSVILLGSWFVALFSNVVVIFRLIVTLHSSKIIKMCLYNHPKLVIFINITTILFWIKKSKCGLLIEDMGLFSGLRIVFIHNHAENCLCIKIIDWWNTCSSSLFFGSRSSWWGLFDWWVQSMVIHRAV